jgi:hypothetical protein
MICTPKYHRMLFEYFNNGKSLNRIDKEYSFLKGKLQHRIKNEEKYGVPLRKRGRKRKTLSYIQEKLCIHLLDTYPNLTLKEILSKINTLFDIDMSYQTFHKYIRNKLQYKLKRMRKYNISNKTKQQQNEYKKYFSEQVQNYINQGYVIVFIDETNISDGMTSNYGWCKRGKDKYPKIDIKYNEKSTKINSFHIFSAVTHKKLEYLSVKNKPFNSNDIVNDLKGIMNVLNNSKLLFVMDNASIHKTRKVKRTIKDNGNSVLYTPVATPQYNSPVENLFGIMKFHIKDRKHKAFKDIKIAFNLLINITEQKLNRENFNNMYNSWFNHIFS